MPKKNKTLIQPRTLKGFPDLLPGRAMQREQMLETLRRVFRSYGFAPIDTPTLEYTEILLAKGGGSAAGYFFPNGTKALDWCLAVVTFSQPRG